MGLLSRLFHKIIVMEIIKSAQRLSQVVNEAIGAGKSIGLVPTMGALHDGHLSLVKRARNENDVVVVSVFVNPTQFNNPTDLATYPRTEAQDAALLDAAGVDYCFMPTVGEIYPNGEDNRQFDLGEVAQVMEGPMRPGHFNGVAQVVSRLFDLVKPTRAYFGEKDFQQIAVIRRMVANEGYQLEIVACPICRADDGLALSSRNVRLTPEQRAIAPAIYRILRESVRKASGMTVDEVKQQVVKEIDAIPQLRTEYYEIVNPLTMQPVTDWNCPDGAPQGCITVYCGEVRLIDNIKYN